MANQENIPDRGHYRTEARVGALGWSRYSKGVDRARDRVEGGVSSSATGLSGSVLEIQLVAQGCALKREQCCLSASAQPTV